MFDDEYFLYGEHQDCVKLRRQYLTTALQISSSEHGFVFLLNPKVVSEAGEWEAWYFGNKLPGAVRYRNFYEFMVAEVFRAKE